jgi:DNA (cytosine-5)-methyltransferase 1
MGWKDSDIDRALSTGVSETQLYKMAGNSIVVNCLTEIFKRLNEGGKENV